MRGGIVRGGVEGTQCRRIDRSSPEEASMALVTVQRSPSAASVVSIASASELPHPHQTDVSIPPFCSTLYLTFQVCLDCWFDRCVAVLSFLAQCFVRHEKDKGNLDQ